MSERHIYVTSDTIFTNSQCLFVEYNDVIKMPMFVLLLILKNNKSMKNIFNMREIVNLSLPELYEWYTTRKHINFLEDLPLKVSNLPDNFFDETLNDLMLKSKDLYNNIGELSFADVLRMVIAQEKLVKRIVIYNKGNNDFIRNDVYEMYGDHVEFIYGNFREVIENIPNDSTYVFSDINKINILAEMERLNFASILIPHGYRYNLIDSETYKVNFEELLSKFTFKYEFFNSIAIN